MKRIVINADDFGKSPSINEAIVRCMTDSFITSTSIMVNMDYVEEAVELSIKYGFFDKVGLHLNLTEGMPLSEGIKDNRIFTDEEGVFNSVFHANQFSRLYLNKKDRKALYDEIKAQFERFRMLGFTSGHLDSHHHVHTDWSVYSQLRFLLYDYGFNSMRISRNINIKGIGVFKKMYKKFYNRSVKNHCTTCADLFGDFNDFIEDDIKGNAFQFLELMCHPDIENGKLINLAVENPLCFDFTDFCSNFQEYRLSTYK